MAWIKLKDRTGNTFKVPEGVYNALYKGRASYCLAEESKPSPNIEEKIVKKEIKTDGIQKPKVDEGNPVRKSPKKDSQ